jgi:hypothetical protein
MSIAADLFHSSNVERETLHRRITPTDPQFEDQQTRWNDLASFLGKRLKDDTGLATSTWLQGSYKFDTQIRPWTHGAEFDIDLGFYFEWAGEPGDGAYEPEELKALIQQALKDYQADDENDATGVEDPKERCCRISFKPDFHIDVPCYHLDRARDARALATETKDWEESDPKAIYKWFKERYDDAPRRAQLRRLVRYLKMWAALNFSDDERPSSILLSVLAAEALSGYAIAGVDDDDLLEHAAIILHARLAKDQVVPNPVNRDEDLNRLGDADGANLVDRLADLKAIAGRAHASGDKSEAAEIWAEAYGQFFPMPEDNEEAVAKTETARNAVALYRFDPQIEVSATPKANRHRHWSGLNELPAIPKDCEIVFRLANARQLPIGASLRWTVRNRGDEAAQLNDLGHPAGDEIQITERSAYNGDHAMDLTVYVGTQVVGRRRIWVKIRGVALPPRNRPRRRYF